MNSSEVYRIGMFRDTGMTAEEIANQLGHRVKTVDKVFEEIDKERDKENHWKQVEVVVRVWDTDLKRYFGSTFEFEINFKSVPYREGVERISEVIKKLVEAQMANPSFLV